MEFVPYNIDKLRGTSHDALSSMADLMNYTHTLASREGGAAIMDSTDLPLGLHFPNTDEHADGQTVWFRSRPQTPSDPPTYQIIACTDQYPVTSPYSLVLDGVAVNIEYNGVLTKPQMDEACRLAERVEPFCVSERAPYLQEIDIDVRSVPTGVHWGKVVSFLEKSGKLTVRHTDIVCRKDRRNIVTIAGDTLDHEESVERITTNDNSAEVAALRCRLLSLVSLAESGTATDSDSPRRDA